MSPVSVIAFGNAWAEYVRCAPSAMEHRLEIIDRPDTEGVDMKQFPRKPEQFAALCVIMETARAYVTNRVRQWQALQGNCVETLWLPEGAIPYCVLLRVRRMQEIQEMALATNNCTHRQALMLEFMQIHE